MYNSSAAGGAANSISGSRLFLYEVEGLRQNQETDRMDYPIRKSGSVFITVPYARMNQEMQRITRMGGRIVSIRPLNGDNGVGVAANGKIASSSEPVTTTSAEASKPMTQAKGKRKRTFPSTFTVPMLPFVGKCLSKREACGRGGELVSFSI